MQNKQIYNYQISYEFIDFTDNNKIKKQFNIINLDHSLTKVEYENYIAAYQSLFGSYLLNINIIKIFKFTNF